MASSNDLAGCDDIGDLLKPVFLNGLATPGRLSSTTSSGSACEGDMGDLRSPPLFRNGLTSSCSSPNPVSGGTVLSGLLTGDRDSLFGFAESGPPTDSRRTLGVVDL